MWIFRNNINKLPACININGMWYNLVICKRKGYRVMYLSFIHNRVCSIVDKDGNEDLLITIEYNFNKAINKMLKKINEYNINIEKYE